ncbi:MAG: hypothetical protein OIF40_11055, partial [Mangrovicoccus sp.]|nr:hypothetical protein [Mangrovicoccus sp.]
MFLTPLRAFLRLSSVRHALGLLAVFALFSTLAWGGTYWLVYREMMIAVDARLTEQMSQAVAALEAGEDLPMALPGQSIALQNSAGPEGFFTYDPEGEDAPALRVLRRQSAYGQIVLREDVERQEELRDILSGGMITSLLGTLLATALAALWVGRRGQNRLDQISDGLAKV